MLKRVKYLIPTLLTLGNLLCGFMAIASGNPKYVLLLVLAGATLDLFDGLAARLLKATSEFGKQLDSLADIVTFGIAPAVAVYNLMEPALYNLIIVSMIPVFSSIRLAKFNISDESVKYFRGLPTPANGIFFASVPFVCSLPENELWCNILLNPGLPFDTIWLYVVIIIFSLLMISPLKMFSLKSLFSKRGVDQYFVAALFIITLPTALSFGWVAAPAAVIFYIILSVIYHMLPSRLYS